MRRLLNKLFLAAGVLLLLDGILVTLSTNMNLGNVLTLLTGAFFTGCGIWHGKIQELTARGPGRVLKCMIAAGLCFVIGMIAFLGGYGMHSPVTYNEDAVIVLGAAVHGDKVSRSLAHRLDEAVLYSVQNEEAVIVVSGGQGSQETVTEASAMEAYLIEKGVDPLRIIREEHATSTYENFKYSKQILDDRFGSGYNCVYITNDYHTFRAGQIAEDAGLKAVRIGSETDWWYTPSSYFREILAVMKYWVFGY